MRPQSVLDGAEAALELDVGAAQRLIGVDLQVAGQINHREEQVADLAGHGPPVGLRPVQLGLDLADFFPDLGKHQPCIVPVEAHRRRLGLQLVGAHQRRQAGRNAIQQPLGRFAAVGGALGLLLGFFLLPEAFGGTGSTRILVTEDMRMAANHLGGDGLDHVAELEQAGFSRHLGVIDGLEEEVAELVLEVVHVTAGDGIGHLVGFFDRVRRDGREVLLDVPGAAGLLVAQRGHDLDQARDIA